MSLIKIFVSDIDGCIAQPYEAYALDGVAVLASHIARAEEAFRRNGYGHLPRFSLCSGRAYPYVEAVAQMLNVRVPVLFESGAGMFDLPSATVSWHPDLPSDIREQLAEVRRWFELECIPKSSFMFDFGKVSQCGIITGDGSELDRWVPIVEEKIAATFPHLKVYHTHVSIDVLPEVMDKERAVHWLAGHMNVRAEEMAYFGDTNGDINALKAVGFSLAPANATPAVKDVVDQVTDGAVLDGVIEGYLLAEQRNGERFAIRSGAGHG